MKIRHYYIFLFITIASLLILISIVLFGAFSILINFDNLTLPEMKGLGRELHYNVLFLIVLLISVLIILSAAAFSSFFRIQRPVERLKMHVDEFAGGNYSARCDLPSVYELRMLSLNFNKMADSLESDMNMHTEAMDILRKSEEGERLRERLSALLGRAGPGIRESGEIPDDVVTVVKSGTTRYKGEEEQLRYMESHDELTGMPAIKLARDRLSMAISRARRDNSLTAVMIIDLDGFKEVNDSFGHEAGDEILKVTAKRLISALRGTDTVARIGGDEFLVILTELHSRDNASLVAEKLLNIISQPVYLDDSEASVGASIGIAFFPDDGSDVEELIKMADAAMYKVKSTGKRGYLFVKG